MRFVLSFAYAFLRGREPEPATVTKDEAEKWMEDPRDTFVPHCVGVVRVRFVEYLPLSAIEAVCEEAGNHAGCHAWAEDLKTIFYRHQWKKGEEGDFDNHYDDFSEWCGGFYDWFHKRFSDRCASQCHKLACKPICEYEDTAKAFDEEKLELSKQEVVVATANARLMDITADSKRLNSSLTSAERKVERANMTLNSAKQRRDEASRALGDSQALVLKRQRQLENSTAALEAAEVALENKEAEETASRHSLEGKEVQLNIDEKAVDRASAKLATARLAYFEENEKLKGLQATRRKDAAALAAVMEEIAAEQKDNAKAEADYGQRTKEAKAALEEAEADLKEVQERAAYLAAELMKPADLGHLAGLQSKLAAARTEEPVLKAEVDTAQRQYNDLELAMKLVEDAKKVTDSKLRDHGFAEDKLEKLDDAILDAGGKANESAAERDDAAAAASDAQGILNDTQIAVFNATSKLENAEDSVSTAQRTLFSARATLNAAEEASDDAENDASTATQRLATMEAGVKEALDDLANATAIMNVTAAEVAQVAGEMQAEQDAVAALRAEFTNAQDDFKERSDKLGPRPFSSVSPHVTTLRVRHLTFSEFRWTSQ